MTELERRIRAQGKKCVKAQAALDQQYDRRATLWMEARAQDPPVPFRTIAAWSGVTTTAVTKVVERNNVAAGSG